MTGRLRLRWLALLAGACAGPLWALVLVAVAIANATTGNVPAWVLVAGIPVVAAGWIAVLAARRSVARNPRLSHPQRRQWEYDLRGVWFPVLLPVYVWKHER